MPPEPPLPSCITLDGSHTEPAHAQRRIEYGTGLVLPPLVYGAAFIMGLLLHLVFPLHILPDILARGIGVVCVLVSCPLALLTLRVLSRAHTPVDPMKPTTALVTEGPFTTVAIRSMSR